MDNTGKNLVHLLCVPRSGSSLVTTMLQNHSKISATQEMWFLMSLHDLRIPQSRPYGGKVIVDRFFNGVLPDQMFEQACRAFAMQVYNGLLQTSGAQMVVDKSPRYYYILEFLDKLFPQAKRIWLIRNPLGIISSYKKVSHLKNSKFNIAEDLLNPKFNIKMVDITVGLFRYFNYFSTYNPYTYKIHYEQLVSNPEEEMEKLCNFLGIDYEEGLHKYGDYLDSPKGMMYASMGVGDPLLFDYTQPHSESINSWKEILDKREVEMYCRVLGARIFHDLGYSEQLAEAEKWTGVQFDMEPDKDILQLRTKQLMDVTKCKWEEHYQINSEVDHIGSFFNKNEGEVRKMDLERINDSTNPEIVQLQIALQSLEKRLETSYLEQDRLRDQLFSTRDKIEKIKSIVPFSNYLIHWASTYLLHGRRNK